MYLPVDVVLVGVVASLLPPPPQAESKQTSALETSGLRRAEMVPIFLSDVMKVAGKEGRLNQIDCLVGIAGS